MRIEGGEDLPAPGRRTEHAYSQAGLERFDGVVFNEALCMKLAAAAGLSAAAVETRNVEGIDYLLVDRYDRIHRAAPSSEPLLERLHQEDFCQALGIVSEQKYQKEGGPRSSNVLHCFAKSQARP